MILVDTSVWVDHFRSGDPQLGVLLESDTVLAHPWVLGELALGSINRREILLLVAGLPRASVATDAETMRFIEENVLYGAGIGFVDAQLLASTRLTSGARLWTRDKRLAAAAERLHVAAALH